MGDASAAEYLATRTSGVDCAHVAIGVFKCFAEPPSRPLWNAPRDITLSNFSIYSCRKGFSQSLTGTESEASVTMWSLISSATRAKYCYDLVMERVVELKSWRFRFQRETSNMWVPLKRLTCSFVQLLRLRRTPIMLKTFQRCGL